MVRFLARMIINMEKRQMLMVLMILFLISDTEPLSVLRNTSLKPRKEVCQKPMDLVLILDASGSVKNDWGKEVSFAEKFVDQFEVGHNKTHIGVIYFGSDTFRHVDLNKEEGYTENMLRQKVNQLEKVGKYIRHNFTETSDALDEAVFMFCESPPERKPLPKLLVVLTDGHSTYGSHALKNPVKRLHDQNVVRLTLGVNLHKLKPRKRFKAVRELEYIASKHEGKRLAFNMNGFNNLLRMVSSFANTVCGTVPQPEKFSVCSVVDLVIILDNSWSIADYYFMESVKFAKKLALTFQPISETKSHIGVIRFATNASIVLDLNTKGKDFNALNTTMESTAMKPDAQLGQQTRTDRALKLAVKMFDEVPMTRRVPKLLVVVSDGRSTKGIESLRQYVSQLKNLTVTTITLGVDLKYTLGGIDLIEARKELNYMASPHPITGNSLFFDLNSFDVLVESVQRLRDVLCSL